MQINRRNGIPAPVKNLDQVRRKFQVIKNKHFTSEDTEITEKTNISYAKPRLVSLQILCGEILLDFYLNRQSYSSGLMGITTSPVETLPLYYQPLSS